MGHDIKSGSDRVYVEATGPGQIRFIHFTMLLMTGPWHRVTWLETSLVLTTHSSTWVFRAIRILLGVEIFVTIP